MTKKIILFLLSINCLAFCSQNQWQDFWLNGLKCVENNQYIQAKELFESAVSNMSEGELQENPEVLIHLLQANFMLQNFDIALQETKNLLLSYQLSDQQKLICGNFLVSILWLNGEEEKSVEAYSEYIINSRLAPKCFFSNDKIIINNIPPCENCKNLFRSFFVQEFCENQTDFHEYGNVWVIERKTKCQCIDKKKEEVFIPKKIAGVRDEVSIRRCCNKCSTIGVAAGLACSRIPHFFGQAVCALFVESARQICVECCFLGGWEEFWAKFAFWKDDFYKKNPRCPPPEELL